MKLECGRTLPNQSTQVQALEAPALAALRTGKGWVPQLGSVASHEALMRMTVQEEAVGGQPMGVHPPLRHTPLLSRHLERNTQELKVLATRTT